MASHNLFGKKGEMMAAAFLQAKGYAIAEMNWRFGKAEVDIIARHEDKLIFAEVKTRSSSAFGRPEDFVTGQKEMLLKEAADEYLYQHNFEGEIRFDIVSVLFLKNDDYTIEHIEDAFW
jgi:putative endonuclease